MEFFWRALTGILPAICVGRSLQKLFSTHSARWKFMPLYFLFYSTFNMPSWVGDENPILLFPFFMLVFLLCLSGKKLSRLVLGGIFYTLLLPLNMLLDSLYRDRMLIIALVSRIVLWCLLAWFIMRIVPEGGLRLSKRLWRLLGGLTLGPLVATLSLSLWGYRFIEVIYFDFYYAVLQRLGFTILPPALFSALALLIAAVVLSRHELLEQETKLAALREIYYNDLKQEQTRLRSLRHDLRNHVTALQGLMEQGKQVELTRYLTALSDSPALGGGRRYAKNETANVVLCSKAAQMEEEGLTADFEVSLPVTLSILAPELCALLGNALDNAIAGVKGAKNRTITLRARLEKGVFMLQVQNALGSTVNEDFSTTKADATQHGYGLVGMQEIARRQGGSLEAAAKDGHFELLICFPCTE